MFAGLNDAVTPVGKPATVNATDPLNPPCGETEIVAVPVLAAATLAPEAEEVNLKPEAVATVSAMVVCAESVPDVPVTVIVAKPVAAEADAESRSTPALIAAVTPVGNPLIAYTGVPMKPFNGVTVIAVVPDVPCVTLKLAGAAPMVKLGPAFTVKFTATEVDAVPEVPVMVTVLVPVAAADVALNVATLEVAVDAGLNDTVTPVGRPVAVSATLPVNPLFGATVMVLVAPAPCATLNAGVEVVKVNNAVGATVSAIAAVAVRLPDFPVTVTAAVPTAALALATKLNVLAGLKDAVTPAGKPETVKATDPVNPFAGTTAMAAVPVAPRRSVSAVGAVSLKLGAAVTVSVNETLDVSAPETPETTNG